MTETTATELRILLFNVSGTSNAAGMPEAQTEGVKRVSNREELALDKFITFIFCSDKVTNQKKRVFNEILQTSSPTCNEKAAIFYNKMAESPFHPEDVPDVPMLPLHLEHWKQKQKAKECIQTVKNSVTKWSAENSRTQDELKDARQLCQKAMSLLDLSPLRDRKIMSHRESVVTTVLVVWL